jgi:putative ABC transport system permease protein
MIGLLSISFRNLMRNKRRNLVTLFSLSASTALCALLLSVTDLLYGADPVPQQALRLVTRNRVSLSFKLPKFYGEEIEKIPGVRTVMMSSWFGGTYKNSRDAKNIFPRFAAEPEKLFIMRSEMQMPESEKQAFLNDRTGCVIGRPLARKLGIHTGEHMILQGDLFPVVLDLTVRGIYDADENNEVLYFNRLYLEENLPEPLRGFTARFNILAESADAVPRIARTVDERFRNSPVKTKSESERAFGLSFVAFLGNVKGFLLTVFAALATVLMLVSGNTAAMSIRERVREIGVLRTLGFSPSFIVGITTAEIGMLGFAAGVAGCLGGLFLCHAVRVAPSFVSQLRILRILDLTLPAAIASMAVSIVFSVLSTIPSSLLASRRPVIEALRTVD